MKKIFFVFVFFCVNFYSNSQQLIYNSKGNIKDKTTNEPISSSEMRNLLKNHPDILLKYNEGRAKKTLGNALLIGGLSLMSADLLIGLTSNTVYPSTLTYIGAVGTLLSFPVKIGFLKKIREAVFDYNSAKYSEKVTYESEMIINANGVSFRINF